jgi:hypothetical protein
MSFIMLDVTMVFSKILSAIVQKVVMQNPVVLNAAILLVIMHDGVMPTVNFQGPFCCGSLFRMLL